MPIAGSAQTMFTATGYRTLALSILALVHAATYYSVTSDDALISLRYSVNIANGLGAVYNPGGSPVEGFSNPLFTFLTAALISLGATPLLAVKLLGVGALALLVPVTVAVARSIDGAGAPRVGRSAWVAGLALAASSYVALWSVAGLETMVHALLVTSAVAVTMRDTRSGLVLLSPPAWLLVTASRPEGVFLALFAFLAQWALLGLRPSVPIRWTLLCGIPAAALLALRFAYFGDLVPNTFHAKVSFGDNSTYWGLQQLRSFFVEGGYWLVVPALGFVAARLRSSGLDRSWLVAAAVVVAQAVFVTLVGGDFMPAYRFIVPAYPLLCALAAAGLATVAARSSSAALMLVAIAAVGLPYSQSTALAQHPLRFWLEQDRPWYAYLGQTSHDGTWLAAHEAAGSYIRARAREGDRLAVTEAGAIPFYAGTETIDLLGLNHKEIARMWQAASRAAAKAREARKATDSPSVAGIGWSAPGDVRFRNYDVASFVFRQQPRWIVLDGSFTAGRGDFMPRLQIGRTLMENLQFGAYRKVFEAKVYDGKTMGLGADRIDVVFERRGSRRKR